MKNKKGWIVFFVILLLTVFIDDSDLNYSTGSSIALLDIKGAIMQESSGMNVGSRAVANAILDAAKNDNIKALFLDINSPGGTVGGSQEIYWALRKFREAEYIDENMLTKNKIIHSYIGELGASGGYYAASASNHISSLPSSLVGSIGVIFSNFNFVKLMEKVGIQDQTFTAGEYKDLGSSFKDMSDEDRIVIQEMIDESYEVFVQDVAWGRKDLGVEGVRSLANGWVYSGNKALENGLIDAVVYSYEDALNYLCKEVGESNGCKTFSITPESDPFGDIFNIFGRFSFLNKELFAIY